MIRGFEDSDIPIMELIHANNGLPENCLPDVKDNPLFVVKSVYEHEGSAAMMCLVKVTGEIFLFLDHTIGTPEERWEQLKEFKKYIRMRAWQLGLDQLSAWIPEEIEKSFGKRLNDLGFVKSPYACYTLNLD